MNNPCTRQLPRFIRGFILSVFLLCAIAPAALFAEGGLSLEAIRQMAYDQSSALKTGAMELESSKLQKAALKYDWYPGLSVGASYGASVSPEDASINGSASASASLSQQLWDGGKAVLERKLAGGNISVAEYELETSLLDVRKQCDSYYFAYAQALSKQLAGEADLAASDAALEKVETQYATGAVSRLTYLEAKTNAASRKTQLLKLTQDSRTAYKTLISFIGAEDGTLIDIHIPDRYLSLMADVAAMDDKASGAFLSACKSTGLTLSPQLAKSKAETELAGINAAIDRKKYVPSLSLSVSEKVSAGSDWEPSYSTGLSVGASLTLSQWDRGLIAKQSEIAMEKAALAAAESLRTYDLETDNAWSAMRSAAQTVIPAKMALDYAEELYRETEESFRLSMKTYSDLADAEATMLENRSAYITAQFDFLLSMSEMMNILGIKDEVSFRSLVSGYSVTNGSAGNE